LDVRRARRIVVYLADRDAIGIAHNFKCFFKRLVRRTLQSLLPVLKFVAVKVFIQIKARRQIALLTFRFFDLQGLAETVLFVDDASLQLALLPSERGHTDHKMSGRRFNRPVLKQLIQWALYFLKSSTEPRSLACFWNRLAFARLALFYRATVRVDQAGSNAVVVGMQVQVAIACGNFLTSVPFSAFYLFNFQHLKKNGSILGSEGRILISLCADCKTWTS